MNDTRNMINWKAEEGGSGDDGLKRSFFKGKNMVTPSVTAPVDTNVGDKTDRISSSYTILIITGRQNFTSTNYQPF